MIDFDKHYDYCRAHPVLSIVYMFAVCLIAVALGHCFRLPRLVYAPVAYIVYLKVTQ